MALNEQSTLRFMMMTGANLKFNIPCLIKMASNIYCSHKLDWPQQKAKLTGSETNQSGRSYVINEASWHSSSTPWWDRTHGMSINWCMIFGSLIHCSALMLLPFKPTRECRLFHVIASIRGKSLTSRHYHKLIHVIIRNVNEGSLFSSLWWRISKLVTSSRQRCPRSTHRCSICRNVVEKIGNVSEESKPIIHGRYI